MQAMSLNRFIHTLETAIEAVEPGTLSAQTNYKELKVWDSLAVLTVIDAIEMEYGVLLNRNYFQGAETVEGLYGIIREKMKVR